MLHVVCPNLAVELFHFVTKITRVNGFDDALTGILSAHLLAELTATDPMFSAAASGVLTASAITQDASANATGTASWFRVVDSTATVVMDGNCGTSGSDLNLTTLSIVITQPVSITSFVLTEGNP